MPGEVGGEGRDLPSPEKDHESIEVQAEMGRLGGGKRRGLAERVCAGSRVAGES